MTRVATFDNQATIGRWGELRAIEWLTQNGYSVRDVTQSKEHRAKDIDLIVTAKGVLRQRMGVEVKADTHCSGNLFLETEAVGNQGCITYTKADYLFYYWINLGSALLIPVPTLQHWLITNLGRYRTASPVATRHNQLLPSFGHIVPGNDVVREVPGTFRVGKLPKFGDANGPD